MAQLWIDGLRGICARFAGAQRGYALAALVDGVLLQALVTGDPLDAGGLRAGVEALPQPPNSGHDRLDRHGKMP